MHFNAKQYRYSSQSPISGTVFVSFRSSFVRSLLLNMGPYGGNNPDGIFSLFYKQVDQE